MSLKKNLIANYLGQGWAALMGLLFIPVYIGYLGMESFALIGVFAILQAWLALMDMGMSATLNREMARFLAGAHTPQSIRDLMRSFEWIGVAVSFLIAATIWSLSIWLASDWLRAEELPIEVVSEAIVIMGCVVASRLLEGLYRGTLLGLQKHVIFNALNAFFATLRAVGAIAVLEYVSPTIFAYFVWQLIVSFLALLFLAVMAYGRLPAVPSPARFSWTAIRGIWRFAGGMLATTFLVLLLMQVDKILLSTLLSLEIFGYYVLATTAASAVGIMVGPIAQAFYPRFSEIVARGDTEALAHAYHFGAQLVTTLVAPVGLILVFFGEWILQLWTGDRVLAGKVAPLLALLASGALLNGLMMIPYMLTLAYGWSGFAVRVNGVAVIVLVPAIIWATVNFGAEGAAWAWVLLNVGYVLVSIRFLHRRLLQKEMWGWYRDDVVLPLAAVAAVNVICVALMPYVSTEFAEIVLLSAAVVGSILAAGILSPAIRISMLARVKRALAQSN